MAIVACAKCGIKNRVDEKAADVRQPVCGKCGAALDSNAEGQVDTSRPRIVTDATFEKEVLEAGGVPVLVDCWAPWCGPCRIIGPVLDQLAAESKGRYVIGKLNVDDNPQTAGRFGVRSIPTILTRDNSPGII